MTAGEVKLAEALRVYLRAAEIVRMAPPQGWRVWRVISLRCMGCWWLVAVMPVASAWGAYEVRDAGDPARKNAVITARPTSDGLTPRYGHYIHLGLSVQRADMLIHGPEGARIDAQTFDLLGAQFHYSYQSILTQPLSYFVGTGMAVLSPSSLLHSSKGTVLPLSYNIPSIWLGLVMHLQHKFKIMLSGEYGLRWFYPLQVDNRPWQPGLGLKTNDYEVIVHGQYDLSSRRALFVAVAKEWLRYQPQEYTSRRVVNSPLQWVNFRMDAWKLSGGWVYHF